MDAPINDSQQIRITSVHGGDKSDHNDLLNCYFEQLGNPGDYVLRNQIGEQIWTAPSLLRASTRTFRFIFGGYLWTVDNFHLHINPARSTADGHWVNDHNVPEQDEGDFHAQSGGGAEEDEYASSANA